jgi:hypothetical protein
MHFLLAPRGGRYGVVGKRSLTREHGFPKPYFIASSGESVGDLVLG